MDNKKIGKLIADLRKKKGLTQQELGDKVGVGFRSVSKWERGITLPDITIINEISKILGITSDELLSGKINKEHNEYKEKKVSSKFKITFSIIITLIVILITSLIYHYNQTYTYALISDDYYIEGNAIFERNTIFININKLEFTTKELYPVKIKNYDYQIKIADKVIFGYGHSPNYKIETSTKDIESFLQSFRVNYNGEIDFTRKEILENNIVIKLVFVTEANEKINKEIVVKLTSIENDQK